MTIQKNDSTVELELSAVTPANVEGFVDVHLLVGQITVRPEVRYGPRADEEGGSIFLQLVPDGKWRIKLSVLESQAHSLAGVETAARQAMVAMKGALKVSLKARGTAIELSPEAKIEF